MGPVGRVSPLPKAPTGSSNKLFQLEMQGSIAMQKQNCPFASKGKLTFCPSEVAMRETRRWLALPQVPSDLLRVRDGPHLHQLVPEIVVRN